jgi:hypothetical protein
MTTSLDQEPRIEGHDRAAFDALVLRLSRQSVDKHFDAYADVDWDGPEMAIDHRDPRWALWDLDPLGTTAWYRSQPPETQARLGLVRVATAMRTGWEFENILQRGLLSFAFRLENGRSEFRYLHHEVVEESHHTMMFQEFVNRTGLDIGGLPRPMRLAAEHFVLPLAHWFPSLFFLFVLGGEDPVDHLQRQRLKHEGGHPLLQRIMRIHVTEEARHLSFARHYLKREVPQLGWLRRQILAVATPLLLGTMARTMIYPSYGFARRNGIPRSAVRQAVRAPESRALVTDSVAKVRRLCVELGLINALSRPLWRALGIWAEPAADGPNSSVKGQAAVDHQDLAGHEAGGV